MDLTGLVIIVFIIAAVAGTITSVVLYYVRKEEKIRCYQAAANIVKEKYLRQSLKNPNFHVGDTSSIYDVRMMAYIKNISSKQKKGYVFDVGDGVSFGRKGNCNILLNESTVSGMHCMLFLDHDRVYLSDSSANGTELKRGLSRVNVHSCVYEVLSGDKIIVGSTVFRVTLFHFDGRVM